MPKILVKPANEIMSELSKRIENLKSVGCETKLWNENYYVIIYHNKNIGCFWRDQISAVKFTAIYSNIKGTYSFYPTDKFIRIIKLKGFW